MTAISMHGRYSLSPNQHCQSTEGSTKHHPQPVAGLHPFLSTTRLQMEKNVIPYIPALLR